MTNVNEYRRPTKKGVSLWLDYRINGIRKQESTGLIILDGKDTATKQLNKETLIRFQHLKLEKQRQLMDGIALPLAISRKRTDFFKYFEEYMQLNPSKERRNSSTLKKLRLFWGKDQFPLGEITEKNLKLFKLYLETQLTGETPYDYFKALKAVIKQATKEGLFLKNPIEDIRVNRKSGEAKNALTVEELTQLYYSECSNENVKRAFLFSCYSGLRFGDIKTLKWINISADGVLKVMQAKTSHWVMLQLNGFALKLAGERGKDDALVFPLPTANGTNKNILNWCKKAGIDKKVTYHCARHSFATNLYGSGADIYATSAAMGHKSLKETPRYVRIAETTINAAVLKMQQIN